MFLEVCIDSAESAKAAVKGGADRLELCSSLVIGGLSPSVALLEETLGICRKGRKVAVNAMVRPRFGDFLYTDSEKSEMKAAIAAMRPKKPDGFVFGALDRSGRLDKAFLSELVKSTKRFTHTLHRAFDLTRDPFEALETAIELGFDTILTSGQASSALKGAELLKELNERAAGRITILAGAGISAENVTDIAKTTGITNFHASAKTTLQSKMKFRREGVPMGLPGISEYEIWRTDPAKVRSIRKALDKLRIK